MNLPIIIKYVKENPGIVVIPVLYLVLPFLLSPFREIPLNDDWAYTRTVEGLLKTGYLNISDWTSAALVFQVYWGALFSLIFGYSFGILRVSTMVLSFFGAIAFYFILKDFKIREFYSVTGVLFLVFNPLFFDLTYTFMTDVPYASLMLISLLFYLKGIRRNSAWWLFFGSIVASFAFLTRQLGAFIPFGAMVFFLLNRKRTAYANVFISIAVPVLTFILYFIWYKTGGSTWAQRNIAIEESFAQLTRPLEFAAEVWFRFFYLIEYLGLFLFPLLLAYFLRPHRSDIDSANRKVWLTSLFLWTVAIATTLLLQVVYKEPKIMPFLPNVFTHYLRIFPFSMWVFITIIASIGTVVLGTFITSKAYIFLRNKDWSSPSVFLALVLILHIILTLNHFDVYDEYVIPWLPILILFVLWALNHETLGLGKQAVIICSLFLMAIYSISNTKLYINEAEAKWRAGKYLVEKGVRLEDMSISFEWDGYYLYERVLNDLLKENREQDIQLTTPLQVIRRRAKFYTSYKLDNKDEKIAVMRFPIPLATRVTSLLFAWEDLPKKSFIIIYRVKPN